MTSHRGVNIVFPEFHIFINYNRTHFVYAHLLQRGNLERTLSNDERKKVWHIPSFEFYSNMSFAMFMLVRALKAGSAIVMRGTKKFCFGVYVMDFTFTT